jgi:hypothetical protein
MNKIILLLAVLAALVGAVIYQQKDRKSRLSSGARKGVEMRELLLPALDVNSVQKIRVKDEKSEVNVALNGTTWTVAERGGYEASFDKISRALLALKEQKNTRKQIVGKESWGKIGVQPPGEPNAYGIGTLVELMDDKGNLKKSLILGANVNSSGNANASPFGGSNERMIRIPDDGDTIWVVGNTFSDLETKPDSWIEKAFFDVQKLKSVEVTAAKPEDSWKATRENADATEFSLEGAKPGEKLDNGKINLASLLSAPTFNDVLTKDKAAETMKGAVKARLVTFDGFTYEVQTVKQKVADADKYYLAVAVSADIAKERAPVKDEKAEEKKKNDEAFAEEKKKKEEKLANEKKLAGWVYEVTEYTVSSLLKSRTEVLAAPENKEDAAPPAPGAPASGLPDVSKMLEGLKPAAAPPAFPPASPLPEAPKTEIKPAPAPDANPVTGEKPAAAEPKK